MLQKNLLVSDERLSKFDNIYRLIEDSPNYGAKTHWGGILPTDRRFSKLDVTFSNQRWGLNALSFLSACLLTPSIITTFRSVYQDTFQTLHSYSKEWSGHISNSSKLSKEWSNATKVGQRANWLMPTFTNFCHHRILLQWDHLAII